MALLIFRKVDQDQVTLVPDVTRDCSSYVGDVGTG